MKYCIVKGYSSEGLSGAIACLEKEVNEKIKDGWKPIGGNSTVRIENGVYVLTQSMTKEKPAGLMPS